MWTYHHDLLARPVPRYTSFPTAAEFSPDTCAGDYADALGAVREDAEISLYVHIPYCEQICWYCGCNTGRANGRARVSSYLAALFEEIFTVAKCLGARGKIGRIAFGGGSPNALKADEFQELVRRLTNSFAAESPLVSVELDPRGFGPSWAQALSEVGAAHASLGVQTFAPHVQHAIGRVQPEADIRDAVAALRAAGIRSLNFDLMYGLPGQDSDDLRETIETAITLRPERIALFGYAHMPKAIPRQCRIDARSLAGAAERFDMAARGHDMLVAAGYEAIGFDHFALPHDPLAAAARAGRLRRNFQGFTEDGADVLIGLGASAISQFPDLIVQNEKNIGRYRMRAGAGQLCADKGVRRSARDRARGRAIETLLCHGHADLTGTGLTEAEWSAFAVFQRRQLLTVDGGTLRLAADAAPYARSIAAALDPYRQNSAGRFSHAV
ncbi:coproporphyrinogen dehydrogenase [Pacificimonas sp. WHA3]|uniref:Coproporphyrinogen-III oxidase n=1 Tax=Pacificimonas pallii TaxID=2827236 RepID=A0ABS6SF90_9SPHN|nr:radical SAM protein [Pacificimonas pallii]MBV7256591.1 coproporphyrinogen dehydrogenase [Pacificimonas pallii]